MIHRRMAVMRANNPTKVTATVAKVTPNDVELSSLNLLTPL